MAALHEAGLFRMMMPRWLGGGEAPPSEFVQVIETIARADASTAWCLCQMDVCSIASVYLDARGRGGGVRRRSAALAWGSTTDAKAVAVPGGYRVSGSWEFGSGCHHATWLGGHIPVVEPDGTPRLDDNGQPLDRTMLFPKSAARIADVWRVLGLRGTGSDKYTLEDEFIPEERTITSLFRWPDAPRLKLAAPYRFGGSSLYASGFRHGRRSAMRAACSTALSRCRAARCRAWQQPAGRQHGRAGRGRRSRREARIGPGLPVAELARQSRRPRCAGGELSMDERMKIRAAGTYAIRLATGVVKQLYELAGSTAIFEGNPFERRFRDAHTVSQHAQGRISHLETVGKHLLGIEQVPRFV